MVARLKPGWMLTIMNNSFRRIELNCKIGHCITTFPRRNNFLATYLRCGFTMSADNWAALTHWLGSEQGGGRLHTVVRPIAFRIQLLCIFTLPTIKHAYGPIPPAIPASRTRYGAVDRRPNQTASSRTVPRTSKECVTLHADLR